MASQPNISVAILTPGDEAPRGRWVQLFDGYSETFRALGFDLTGMAWTSDEDLARFDLVLPLLAWTYHVQTKAWLAQLERWETRAVRIHNPTTALRWNTRKTYLGDLAARGVETVPTIFVDRLTVTAIAEAAAKFQTKDLIVKPQVSGGAYRTLRLGPNVSLDEGPEGPAMIQPYFPSVESAGEVSLFYFNGELSHAVRKVPQAGDFRVQPEYRGIITAVTPSGDERELAERTLGAIAEDLLYARVDLLRAPDGKPALIELELIEPDLYLGYAADRGEAFSRALLTAARPAARASCR